MNHDSQPREKRKRNSTTLREEVLRDFRTATESRFASLTGRKEVLLGKAKFGIFGDGKEVPQIAMAKAFRPGDFRSGYYRDQTFMLATGGSTLEQFFAQLYAHPDLAADPFSAGRQMSCHYASRSLDQFGEWRSLVDIYNSAADLAPTSAQMPRTVGLGLASKLYRENHQLADLKEFSRGGNEVTFCTIGDASTSEGLFWETVNAIGVLKIPVVISVWDDGYGISVPRKYQTTKGSISAVLEGFRVNESAEGFEIYRVKGWDYSALCSLYVDAVARTRKSHIPSIIHVEELTQPQGHSTSGSHERYKSAERLTWEREHCCIRKMREWIVRGEIADERELKTIEAEAEARVHDARNTAWSEFTEEIRGELRELIQLLGALCDVSAQREEIGQIKQKLEAEDHVLRREVTKCAKQVLRLTRGEESRAREALSRWDNAYQEANSERYSSHLYSHSRHSALLVKEVKAVLTERSEVVNGNRIIQRCMDEILARDPRVCIFGEDVGIGDVNHGLVGLPEKYGKHRIFDTGIREATIVGQGIGLALRGLRPIAEIQYLDYLIFGIQPLTDDLATLQYRTKGGQKAPLIVRTRGHRLEGIWHTGSPMGVLLNAVRGIYVLVPRNMTQAAGFYNTLLRSDEPGIVIECLNGYVLKERMPDNIGDFTVPLGIPEVLRKGTDVTVVSYGSCCRVAEEAALALEEVGISIEVLDVQSLIPFDLEERVAASLAKTNRLVILDEDVPGGASAYILQQVLEAQGGYSLLDSKPVTVTAREHRSPYGSDGDYFSKPSSEDLFAAVYQVMRESAPERFPAL